jgi:hypothetical protein
MLGLIRLDHLEGDVVRLKLTNIRIRLPYSFLVLIVVYRALGVQVFSPGVILDTVNYAPAASLEIIDRCTY